MNLNRLYEILAETTCQLRKGEVYEGTPALVEQAKRGGDEPLTGGGVLEIYAMPHADEAPAGLERVDMVFVIIGVDKAKAERRRAELVGILDTYPRLMEGPSYIEVGGEIGDQGAAFQLFALGKVLGFWEVITPESLGFKGADARDMAGSGFIMCSGYRPERAPT